MCQHKHTGVNANLKLTENSDKSSHKGDASIFVADINDDSPAQR